MLNIQANHRPHKILDLNRIFLFERNRILQEYISYCQRQESQPFLLPIDVIIDQGRHLKKSISVVVF